MWVNQSGLEAGETTPDQKLSLVTARCVGACGLAPAVVIDDDLEGKLTPEDTLERVREATSRTPAPAEAKA